MAFSKETVEKLLVACHRHCCICHKVTGIKMEIHHIKPCSEDGEDSEENGIPLCFDCHAEVLAYNPQHPKGRRFTAAELRKHKEQWFAICRSAPWNYKAESSPSKLELVSIDDCLFKLLRVDDHSPAQALIRTIEMQPKSFRLAFAARVYENLKSEDEETRWRFAIVVEAMILWEPDLVPLSVIESMSKDPCFSVRSSASMCYYHLARLSPASVPLDVLRRLAAFDEDWYVNTPAVAALQRLARSRPIIVDIFAQDLSHKEKEAREYAASAIRTLVQTEPDLVASELLKLMSRSKDLLVSKIGLEGIDHQKNAGQELVKDYGPF